MRVYTSIQIGDFHTNHCEDFLISEKIGKNKTLIAVMDGCSMGTDSHFAATLFAKILKKISKELFYIEFINEKEESLKDHLYFIMKTLFNELKNIKNQLSLEIEELLSTLILAVYDETLKEAEIITIGDGLIVHNTQITEYEQGDKPDYLAYHLQENFDDWFHAFHQKLSLENIIDLSIMTDGIYTFKRFGTTTEYEDTNEMVHFLAIDQNATNHENLLKGKMIFLQKEKELKPMDDFAIIRIIN